MDVARTRLLERLREGPVAATSLASDLERSPAAIREAITALESDGIDVERAGETFELRDQ